MKNWSINIVLLATQFIALVVLNSGLEKSGILEARDNQKFLLGNQIQVISCQVGNYNILRFQRKTNTNLCVTTHNHSNIDIWTKNPISIITIMDAKWLILHNALS